jgi:membrane associated rhomboid family serine protease
MAALRRHGLVLALAGLCLAVELILAGAERGLWGSVRWRVLAYLNGGFWAGLVRADWEGNYALQPVVMFLSHAVLHAGVTHLATNLIALLALGAAARARVGQAGLAGLLVVSALGGGLAFAALGPLGQPMVGASGVLFGLAGALIVWRAAEVRRAGGLPWDYLALGVALMALNVLSAWAVGWQMAWEGHLGGFIAGGLAALAIRPRPQPG